MDMLLELKLAELAQRLDTAAPSPDSGYRDYAHQSRALELSTQETSPQLKNFALLMDTGTGKSRVLVRTAEIMFRMGMINTLVVLAPNGPHRDWPQHVAEHLSGDIDREAEFYSRSKPTLAWNTLMHSKGSSSRLRVMSVNVEAISHESGVDLVAGLLRSGDALFAIDESQRIRTPKSRRTRNALKLRKLARAARIATGSAITKNIHNLFSQFGFLDRDIIGEKTYTSFLQKYILTRGLYKTIVGPNPATLPELLARLGPYMFQVLLEECTDLPAKTYVEHTVALSDEQRRYYRQLKNAFLLELDSGQVIEAPQVVTRLLRLQQILCGHLPNPEKPGEWMALPCPRLDDAADLAMNCSSQGIVWARFQPDISLLSKRFGEEDITFTTYHGQLKEEARAANLAAWRRGDFQWLIATQQTGGVGLTLNEAKSAIFYSNSYNWEHRKQAEARNWRIGQTEKVVIHDLIVPGSEDVRIRRAHKTAQDTATLLTNVRELRNWLMEDTI